MDARENIIKFLATGAYAGYSPLAPGTAGTIPGVLIALLITGLHPIALASILTILFFVATYVAAEAGRIFGGKDPSQIVCDEVYGFLIASLLIPVSPLNLTIVFLLFRFFDILKPWPAGLIDERLPGGAGIVLDDVVAGVYANISARVIIMFLG